MPYTLRIYITVLLAWFDLIMIHLTSKTWLLDTLITVLLHPDYTLITPLLHPDYNLLHPYCTI
jgi:hypothetical protein